MMQVVLSTKILTCFIGHSTLHNKFLESINISGILRYTIYEHINYYYAQTYNYLLLLFTYINFCRPLVTS